MILEASSALAWREKLRGFGKSERKKVRYANQSFEADLEAADPWSNSPPMGCRDGILLSTLPTQLDHLFRSDHPFMFIGRTDT